MSSKKKLIISEGNLENLSWKLHKLCTFLDKTFDINCGGCCYIAYCLARLLEKDNIPFQVIVYECSYDDFFDIDCSCYHYAIRFENHCIINGFEDFDNYKTFRDVTAKDLLDHYKECGWNNCYNIKYNSFLFHIINMFYYVFTKSLQEK